jgi:voltage-gated potassium channel
VKFLGTILGTVMGGGAHRNSRVMVQLLALLAMMVVLYSVLFHVIMDYEGQQHTWLSSVYWTLVTMSTLGFGDITFTSDLGRLFSVVVLLSGAAFILVLLPFAFIQFVYLPWIESRNEARAPRMLPEGTRDHVVLTELGPIEDALIRRFREADQAYVLIEPDLERALTLHDQGYSMMVGQFDDPATYEAARVSNAALVSTTRSDTANTNITFTVREISERVPIVATASASASIDILGLAGAQRVLHLGEMLGQAIGQRVLGPDAKSYVIGRFDNLLIAEANVAGTPLEGRTLLEARLREVAGINAVGVWDRGDFRVAAPDIVLSASSLLVLAGTQPQLDAYDALFAGDTTAEARVVIIGGGRVGRAAGRALEGTGVPYMIVERLSERVRDPDRYVVGDAAELKVLQEAGIGEATTVLVTTHDDDMNVYLTLYCRKLRPDIQIIGRANLDRNVSTLHRAGADVVMSYASMGATEIWNMLPNHDTLLLAEGLDVFRVPVPAGMGGRTLRECHVRRETGCNVVAISRGREFVSNPDPDDPIPEGSELVLIGDAEAERSFLLRYPEH